MKFGKQSGSGYVSGLMLGKAKLACFSLRDHVAGSSPVLTTKLLIMFIGYYIICVIYCFYQLNKRYRKSGVNYNSPELDAIMVVVMAWILAPVDVSLTWIKWYKEAEQARINQTKFDIDIDLTEDNIN
jgi:hypothetical protein